MDARDRVDDLSAVEARLDPDRRQLDNLGAKVAQRGGEPARLGAGAGYDDAAVMQWPALEPRDRFAACGNGAEEEDRGSAQAGLGDGNGEIGQGRGDGALIGMRAALDRGGGLGRDRDRRQPDALQSAAGS